ncbi:MAG: efflux RND transporter periplasmic adaptor subunit, partial [Polyangiaceae bacterium]|nr:efflux RND transporter periplasmic adaptor subunit [Polyangiaceae bacterium]
LAMARASWRQARAALDRQNTMMEQGVGTERERLDAEKQLAEAQAELSRAEAAVRFVGGNAGTTVVVRSPIAGTVVSRNATVGAAADPGGESLVEVGDPSELWIVADVFERDLHLVREGAAVQVELPSVPDALVGTVVSVGAVVEGNTRAAPVRVMLENYSGLLRPGMFGRARIQSPDSATAIPIEAVLLKDGRQTVVYLETGEGEYARRSVVVAQPADGKVLVMSGISVGDRVVVRGALLLDGAAEQLL